MAWKSERKSGGKPPNSAAAGDVGGGTFGGEWRWLSAADQMKS